MVRLATSLCSGIATRRPMVSLGPLLTYTDLYKGLSRILIVGCMRHYCPTRDVLEAGVDDAVKLYMCYLQVILDYWRRLLG